jgi:hypothetical protein
MQLGSDVCTALESIFTPTSVEYATREVEEGSVSDVRACTFGEPNRPIITNQQKGVSSNLRNAQELRSDVLYDIEQTCESEACFVNQLEIRGKTKLTLADTTQWLDQRSEERVKLYNRTRLVGTASEDPLYVKVKYRKGWNEREDVTDVRYKVHISTFTDIWTETTDIGTSNQHRLEECFRTLRDNIEYDSVDVHFEADRNFGDELASILRT